jgi:general secretion pathway protein D
MHLIYRLVRIWRHRHRVNDSSRTAIVAVLLSFASMASAQTPTASQASDLRARSAASAPVSPTNQTAPPAQNATEKSSTEVLGDRSSGYGSGTFLQRGASKPTAAAQSGDDPPVGFSFENGDLREIVRNILGDLLNENFTIDPQVQGTVTVRTSKPVRRSEVFALLESMLRASGFGIVRDGKYWRVGPLSAVSRGYGVPQSSQRWLESNRQGSSVAIYQALRVGVNELKRLVEPFAKDAAVTLRTDDVRNWIIISAPGPEIERLLEVAAMFDASVVEGMSYTMVTLKYADVKAVVTEYERIFGASAANPLSGLVRVIPLERINALLVISPRPEIVKEAELWIDRLDQPGDPSGGQRLYVYPLLFTQAEALQPLLSQALSSRDPRSGVAPPTVAPGQQAATIAAPISPLPGQGIVTPGNAPGTAQNTATAVQANRGTSQPPGAASSGQSQQRGPSIVADKDRNSLLILATQSEYVLIESVIKKLDVPPKQVAVEVKIAEVALTGQFGFGVSSYFVGKPNDPRNRLSTTRDGVGRLVDGVFSYTWKKSDAIQAILSLEESKGQIRTLAQPTLITLENKKATFSSGTQISVRTQTQAPGNNTGTVDSFQYINTGITINVTPRVSGENVFLEIQHEKSDSAPNTQGGNPDISRSATTTTVMIPSGDTMLLGGLFQDKKTTDSSGLPIVSSIPVIGGLFGRQDWTSNRTELVVLITPRIMSTVDESRQVVDELRKQLNGIEGINWSASTNHSPSRQTEPVREKALK